MNIGNVSSTGVSSAYAAATGAPVDTASAAEAEQTSNGAAASEAAVYEPSNKGANALDADTIKAMKDELEQRTVSLVRQMLGQQIDTLANSGESFWQRFRTGDFNASPEQIAQAQKDVADDGYWGVEQTSDRIVKYATALSGGDPEKLETMISAFEKGYAEAEKAWGGTLPGLCQRTRDAVLEKFDALKKQYAGAAE